MAAGDFNSFLASAQQGAAPPMMAPAPSMRYAQPDPNAQLAPDPASPAPVISAATMAAPSGPAPYDPNASAAHNFVANAIGAIPGALRGIDTNYRTAQLAAGPSALEWLDNTMFGNDASTAQLKARAAAAPTFADPRVSGAIASHPDLALAAEHDAPGVASKFQDLLNTADAAKAQLPTTVNHLINDQMVSKTVADPAKNVMVAKAAGVDPAAANLITTPHAYTDDEFLHEASKLTIGQAQALMAMQHYTSPKDQITMQYGAGLAQSENAAQQRLNEIQKTPNVAPAAVAAAKAAADQATEARTAFQRKISESQLGILPD